MYVSVVLIICFSLTVTLKTTKRKTCFGNKLQITSLWRLSTILYAIFSQRTKYLSVLGYRYFCALLQAVRFCGFINHVSFFFGRTFWTGVWTHQKTSVYKNIGKAETCVRVPSAVMHYTHDLYRWCATCVPRNFPKILVGSSVPWNYKERQPHVNSIENRREWVRVI